MILLASMSAAPAEPQGIIFNRNSCAGQSAAPVRNVVASAAVRIRERPQPIRGILSRFGGRGAGCSGASAHAYSSGCGGGGASAYAGLPMPTAEAPSRAVPPGDVAASGLLSRLAVRSHLREALGQTHEMSTLSAKQRSIAARAATDRRVFNAAVDQVHKDLGNQVGASAFADWFKVIMDNLPAIIDMIEKIIKLFG